MTMTAKETYDALNYDLCGQPLQGRGPVKYRQTFATTLRVELKVHHLFYRKWSGSFAWTVIRRRHSTKAASDEDQLP